jgi:hypothetical protein
MLRNTLLSPAVRLFVASLTMATLAACGSTGNDSPTATTSAATTTTQNATTLSRIDIVPISQTIGQNATTQFAAVGTDSAGNQTNITNAVTWASSDQTVATINPTTGLAQSLSKGGSTQITAKQGAITSTTPATLTVLGSAPTAGGGAITLSSITVTPTNPTLPRKGVAQQFNAIGRYSDGSTQDLTRSVTWSPGSSSVITISNDAGSNGLAQSVGPGTTTINAVSGAVSGSTTVTVAAPVVVGLTVTPTGTKLATNFTLPLTVTASYTDGSSEDVTKSADYQSSNATFATVNNTGTGKGLVTGKAPGAVDINITFLNGTAKASLTVVNATLTGSPAVTPSTFTLPKGLTKAFTATATMTETANTANTFTQDVTNNVTWSTVNTPGQTPTPSGTVAGISNTIGSAGVATALTKGTSNITASYQGPTPAPTLGIIPGTPPAPQTNTATLTVADPIVTALQTSPPNPTAALSTGTLTFTATCVLSDNTTRDSTTTPPCPTITWASDNSGVASFVSTTTGVATLVAAGKAGITAAIAASGAQTAVKSPVNTLTVTNKVLSTLAITAARNDIAQGTKQQYRATAVFSDNTTQDVTATTTWTSAQTSVADFVAGDGSPVGLVTAKTVATSQDTIIQAAFGGITATKKLTVTPATITSISVDTSPVSTSGDPIPMASATVRKFVATGTFSNGTTQDLTTNNVTWTATSTTTPISASVAADGTVTAKTIAAGNPSSDTAIIASFTSPSAGSAVTGQRVVRVSSASVTLSQITVSIPNGASAIIPAGKTLQFSAVGTYSDGTQQDITNTVTWSSAQTAVADVTAAGLATGNAAGTTVISATQGTGTLQRTGTLSLKVTNAIVQSISVTTADPTANGTLSAADKTRQLIAIATYSDTTTQNVTQDVSWVSTNTGVATVGDTANSNKGLVTAAGVGTTLIRATLVDKNNNNAAVTGTSPGTIEVALITSIVISGTTTLATTTGTTQLIAKATYSNAAASVVTVTEAVTWASANTTIATVGDTAKTSSAASTKGLVKGVSNGTAAITAKITDTFNPDQSGQPKTGTATVTVP